MLARFSQLKLGGPSLADYKTLRNSASDDPDYGFLALVIFDISIEVVWAFDIVLTDLDDHVAYFKALIIGFWAIFDA